MEQQFDLAVIGGGPGGYPAALKAAAAGKKTALIEKRQLGGTCLNRGCIPTKTLLHVTGLYREIRNGEAFGLRCAASELDEAAMWQHKDTVVQSLRDGIAQVLKKQKVTVYQGQGCVTQVQDGIVTVEICGENGAKEQITASHVLIAAGSAPARLPIPGSDLPGVLNSDMVLDGNFLGGDDIIIIGGGVIGMEMATVYSNLGRSVTVLEAMDRILPGMDREISQNLKMILKKRGVEIITSAKVRGIEKEDSRLLCRYEVTDRKGNAVPGTAAADHILISTGRKPEIQGLFSESVLARLREPGAVTDWGFLMVDNDYQTAVPGIYAAGDVIGGIQLAHMATAEGSRAIERMFDLPVSQNLQIIPSCVYTDPEIACVGLTADEAKAWGIEAESGKYIMSVNGKSVLTMQERGFIKLVAEKGSGRLLGAQLMCARATDMVGELGLAIGKQMTVMDLASVVMAHPTFSEGIMEAAQAMSKNYL